MDNKQKALLGGGVLGGLLLAGNAEKIIKGIGLGLIVIVLAFLLIWTSVNGVREVSVEVANLSMISLEEAKETRGLVKTYGKFKVAEPVSVEVLRCNQQICTDPEIVFSKDNLLYYEVNFQRFEVVRDVEKSESNGNSETETVSYENKWITKETKQEWANAMLEDINVNPEKARLIIDTESKEVENVLIKDLENLETFGRTPEEDEPEFGTTRAVVRYISADDREYTVVGEMRSDGIMTGDPFIITDKSDTELVNQLGGEESTSRWLMRFGAFLMLTFGFTSMLSPILVFTDLIPVAGKAARGLATLVSGIIAFIIVLATVFLLNYWWIILLVILAGVMGFGLFTMRQKAGSQIKTS